MYNIEALIFDCLFDLRERYDCFVEFDRQRFRREIDIRLRYACELAYCAFDCLLTMTAVHTFYDDDLFQRKSLLSK